MSVEKVGDEQLISAKHDAELASDSEVIEAIEACIEEGINTKMKLAEVAAERTKVSKKSAVRIIDKYTGSDPAIHRWNFELRDRGAKIYDLLF
jgi:hypothetical protein